MDGPVKTLGGLVVAASLALGVSACGGTTSEEVGTPTSDEHETPTGAPPTSETDEAPTGAVPASEQAVAAVEAPDRYGPCLPMLNATNPQYTIDVDTFVVRVIYDRPGGGHLTFSVVPRRQGGYYTVPADDYTTNAIESVEC